MSRLLMVMALLTACNEGGFGDDPVPVVIENPPPLEADTRRDLILQVTEPEVDVLWMIDKSCSMRDHQDELRENFPFFMEYFLGSGLDYHIGVTTSTLGVAGDGNDGRLVRHAASGDLWIDNDTPDPIGRFEEVADVGILGDSEQGIGAVYRCLEERADTENAGFYREHAGLTTVVISDEADYTTNNIITANEFQDWYSDLKVSREQRTFSSIVTREGGRYSNATEYIGGINWNLNENEDLSIVLELLGLQAAGFKSEFFLSQLPVVSSIAVSVITRGGAVVTAVEWDYDERRNSVSFVDYYPEALATVQIDYTLLASESDDDRSGTDDVLFGDEEHDSSYSGL